MTATAARRATAGALVVSVAATIAAIAGGFDDPPALRASLVLLALAPLFAIGLVPALRAALSLRVALCTSAALTVTAAILPPSESHDLWSYAVDGRIVSQYGSSPYVHSPAHYPHDVFLHLVGSGWRSTRSVYGPLFTWTAAALTGITGPSELATRLAFQLLAAVAVLVAVLLVARETRDPIAVLVLGVNPVVAMEIVNPGRNDALVGLALLGGVLLLRRRRPLAAVAVLTLAVLVKAAAVLALGALLLWLAARVGRRVAVRAGALAAAMLVVPYLLAGGLTALRPLASASDRLSGRRSGRSRGATASSTSSAPSPPSRSAASSRGSDQSRSSSSPRSRCSGCCRGSPTPPPSCSRSQHWPPSSSVAPMCSRRT